MILFIPHLTGSKTPTLRLANIQSGMEKTPYRMNFRFLGVNLPLIEDSLNYKVRGVLI